ncbi:activating signal cointegrator 1 complex subunit 1-like [Saccoglossus kowalevskii]|uniref:Activating signal cointegrator 1 complex subunit 1-like n=1 Tax=Saccoglossus kowalevskii TaxID=10224 RepID=A0ABM0MS34_SACKO|nr:PREDICTED: activating signal cointegrator 1 complex subunit 1-like [Saccoglossus kowalevskii]
MDVLKPTLININGRIYRKNAVEMPQYRPDEDEDLFIADDDMYMDESCDVLPIEETSRGYRLAFEIPTAFFSFIIGKKGQTKQRIERETRTQIQIPKMGKDGDIVITGNERKRIVSAKTRIDVLIDSARQRQQFTHFLSVPLNSEQVKNGFEEFKLDVLRECFGDRGLDETLFQNPVKLHLTIGTLVLLNTKEVSQAAEILKQCEEEMIKPLLKSEPLLIDVEGIEYMNDDPSEVDVVYAKVRSKDGSNKLQHIADNLVEKFGSSGLMQKDYDRVKLHCTVINTLFRKDPAAGGVRGSAERNREQRGIKERESFDAKKILTVFENYKFGVHHISSIHISQRYSTSSDGYYACSASISLP